MHKYSAIPVHDKKLSFDQLLEKKYKVFIDTCALLQPEINNFISTAVQKFKKYKSYFIIPSRVLDELKKHSNQTYDTDLARASKRILKVIEGLEKNGYAQIKGNNNDFFADNVFQCVFTKYRMQHNLLLITQDSYLAFDILRLNNSHSVLGHDIEVRKINERGELKSFFFDSNDLNFKDPQKIFAQQQKQPRNNYRRNYSKSNW